MVARLIALEEGWQLCRRIVAPEWLLSLSVDTEKQRLIWSYLDLDKNVINRLRTEAPPLPCDPAVILPTCDLVFASTRGISSFRLSTYAEQLLVPADNNYMVRNLWVSPKDDLELLFIQSDLGMLSDASTAGKDIVHIVREEAVLVSWHANTGRSRIVSKFSSIPVFADVAWEHGAFFASLANGEVIRCDLESGVVSLRESLKAYSSVAVSPRGTLLTWDDMDSGVVETCQDGTCSRLTPFGGFPAFSPGGEAMAFLRQNSELWLKSSDGQLHRIVAFPKTDSKIFDFPTWCHCGNHLAINLVISGLGPVRQMLVVADFSQRLVCMQERSSPASSGGRAWIPKIALCRQHC
ncbi:MAG: hypothetical protein HY748_04105 [Elusimicrobia bacterium]|nr:hypothetical protein [Elusimicrobiota bacterium]